MKTTTTVVLGLMAALVVLGPTAVASDPAQDAQEETTDQCLPVWIDAQGNPQVDPSCIPSGSNGGPA